MRGYILRRPFGGRTSHTVNHVMIKKQHSILQVKGIIKHLLNGCLKHYSPGLFPVIPPFYQNGYQYTQQGIDQHYGNDDFHYGAIEEIHSK